MPVFWKSHIFKVKQEAIEFEQFFDIPLKVAPETDDVKNIRNARKYCKQFVCINLSDYP